MKIKMTLLAASALVSFAGFAQAACGTSKCATECDKTAKKECAEKCATKTECATKCAKTDAAMNVTHFDVSGMTCGGCSKDLTAQLNALEGVSVKKVCHKSGSVDVVIGDKATAQQVTAAIVASGFKIVTPAEKKA